jgi:protein-tyrosine kinase
MARPEDRAGGAPQQHDVVEAAINVESIGELLADLRQLTPEQVERVLEHQRSTGVRFGEAAVALGLATPQDVLRALSQQFHYPFAGEAAAALSEELVALKEPFGPVAEHFRSLRSQLLMRAWPEGEARRALALISPDVGDGRSWTAANTAITLAQLGGRTLLVDANLRMPRLHELFKLPNSSGLSGVLSGRADHDSIVQVAAVDGLFVLPAGATPPNPLELIERASFAQLLRELVAKFDHVVVDTPAAALGADAAVIAARCGSALLLARKDKSAFIALQELVASFAGSHARIAGVVYNER